MTRAILLALAGLLVTAPSAGTATQRSACSPERATAPSPGPSAQEGHAERGTSNCSSRINRWAAADRPGRAAVRAVVRGAYVHQAVPAGRRIRLSARLIDRAPHVRGRRSPAGDGLQRIAMRRRGATATSSASASAAACAPRTWRSSATRLSGSRVRTAEGQRLATPSRCSPRSLSRAGARRARHELQAMAGAALPRRPLLAGRRAGAGAHVRRRAADLRGRVRARATTPSSSACARGCTCSRATASGCGPPPRASPIPVWIDDEDFDLGRHVRVRDLPAPGDDERLGELVGARAVAAPGPQPAAVGADRSSRACRAAARRCWPRCTTRSSTASRRWTSGRCCWTRRPSRSTCPRPSPGSRGATTAPSTSRGSRSARCERAQRLPWDRPLRALGRPAPGAARSCAAPPRTCCRRPSVVRRARAHRARRRRRPRSTTGIGPEPPLRDRRAAAGAAQGGGQARGATVNDAVLAIVTGMLRRYLLAAGKPLGRRPSRSSR